MNGHLSAGAAQQAEFSDLDPFVLPLSGISLIEASAGTGKTWNLAIVYLRALLETGLSVDQLLVMTFTNAATAELRERLRQRLVDTRRWLDDPTLDDPAGRRLIEHAQAVTGLERSGLRNRIDAALAAFDEAAIVTIHGFCQRALARVPFAAGLPFDHEAVADDPQGRLRVAADFWRRRIAAEPVWPPLAELLLLRGDSPARWADLLGREVARPLAVRRWPEGLDELEPVDTAGARRLYQALAPAWVAGPESPLAAVQRSLSQLKANRYKPERVAEAAASWERVLAVGDADAAVRMLLRKGEVDRLSMLSADSLVAGTKLRCVPPAHPFFAAAQSWMSAVLGMQQVAVGLRLRLLRDLIGEGGRALREFRRSRRLLTFDDMLLNLRDALVGGEFPWLAGELHRQYPLALVDEFQDTDALQHDILRAIYPAGPLFLIGDPKQAIYSFRSADLHVYLAARDAADARLTLRSNQRSTRTMIEACNALFALNPGLFGIERLGVPTIEKGVRERPVMVETGCEGHDPALRVWLLPKAGEGWLDRHAAKSLAARAAAAEVARLLAESAAGRLKVADRPLAAGGIAVLVRTHAEGARMRRALAEYGVDSVELSQIGVFQTAEAEELERVLLAIADPAHQGHLLSALATGLIGMEAAQVEALSDDEPALLSIAERWLAYRELWRERGFGRMFQQWMSEEQVDARLLALPDGERRMTDLLHVAELLQRQTTVAQSIDALLRFLSSSRLLPSADEQTQSRLESDRNLVQIVTIHRSKGLEYDVVFCPFLWDGMARAAPTGDAADYHDADGRLCVDFTPGIAEQVKDLRRFERNAEQMRLMYVALTRAVHRCYLIAGLYLSGGSTLQSTRSLLNWLVAGAGQTLAGWPGSRPAEADVIAAWQRLDALAGGAVGLSCLGEVPVPAAAGQHRPGSHPLRALTPPVVPAGWRMGSFSSLRAEAVDAQVDAADHDLADVPDGSVPDAMPAAPPSAMRMSMTASGAVAIVADDDFLRFPRGASAGDCLHAMFEAAEFTDASSLPDAAWRALGRFPQRLDGVDAEAAQPLLARMLVRAATDVLATPLPGGFRLQQVGRGDRLVELAFHLPAPDLPADALEALLRSHGMGGPRLMFGGLSGYLTGYIDLVIRHAGRYYIIDWKSNHLGERARDYAPPSLARAMDEHGYHLQYALYSVAVDRMLRQRVPGYDTARDFGGVLYLFTRGMRPEWSTDDGHPTGVSFHRPGVEFIHALDRLLGGVRENGR